MHEMALAEGVLQIVEDTIRGQNCTRVTAIRLEIGALSHVEPDAMRFCFDAVIRGSVAEGARLEIDTAPGRAWCHNCGHEVALPSLIAACPDCGGFQVQVTGGQELRVKDMEVN
ncbi:MAG: hydrogenase maturation nickel metallochaperone HypA [Rhodobacteraceae bacterium]|nr:hydrogenase maturation nickel metallochaperone HypA [Paracoccaceae bacterium]